MQNYIQQTDLKIKELTLKLDETATEKNQLQLVLKECQMQKDVQANDFSKVKKDLEKENKDLQQRVDMQQHEIDLLRNQMRDLKDANKGLDSTKFSQEKSLTEYMLKI